MTCEEYRSIHLAVWAAEEVFRTLGYGLDVSVYKDALEIEFQRNGIIIEKNKVLPLVYKGVQLSRSYVADIFLNGVVILVRSEGKITDSERKELQRNMRVAGTERGVLIDMGAPYMKSERYYYVDGKGYVLLTKMNYTHYITTTDSSITPDEIFPSSGFKA